MESYLEILKTPSSSQDFLIASCLTKSWNYVLLNRTHLLCMYYKIISAIVSSLHHHQPRVWAEHRIEHTAPAQHRHPGRGVPRGGGGVREWIGKSSSIIYLMLKSYHCVMENPSYLNISTSPEQDTNHLKQDDEKIFLTRTRSKTLFQLNYAFI